MKVWFTSDAHFDHALIIKFCSRPFRDIDHMNREIIRRWNDQVDVGDLVYHVGDFSFKGQGNCKRFEGMLNGDIVHVVGNHDRNNGVKSYIECCLMRYGKMKIFVKHRPPDRDNVFDAFMFDSCDLVLCGHVHNNWKHKLLCGKFVVNVGLDVWGFEPVTLLSILKYISRVKKGVM